jgi:putative hydrolase of the HAD superfamily
MPASGGAALTGVARPYEGLLMDVGGVLTTDLFEAFDAYCARQGVPGASFRELYFGSPEAQRLLHRLEVGEIDHLEAQPRLARILGLPENGSDDLFRGLYADVHLVPEMTRAVEALHASGVRTGVLSNSWWLRVYDDPFYARAFDVHVISGQVGVRKPERAIFERGIEALGVAPELIVFVDDFDENLPPARALGMTGVLHAPAEPERTLEELERLFGVDLG